MASIFKSLLAFILSAVKDYDFRPILYKLFKESILPELKKRSADSASKVDDVIVAGVERFVEAFLAPEKLEQAAEVK